jgi:hypothetical protein
MAFDVDYTVRPANRCRVMAGWRAATRPASGWISIRKDHAVLHMIRMKLDEALDDIACRSAAAGA